MKSAENKYDEWTEDGKKLVGDNTQMPFTIPGGYFEQLPEEMLFIAKSEDLKTRLGNQPPVMTVPGQYFENLPTQILNIVKSEDKRIFTPQKIRTISFVPGAKWAAAAAIALIISVGAYISFFSHKPTASEQMLSSVSATDISEYVQHSCGVDASKVLNDKSIADMKLDSRDIEQYLNETGWE